MINIRFMLSERLRGLLKKGFVLKYVTIFFLLLIAILFLWISSWKFKNLSYTDGVISKSGVEFPCYFEGQEKKEYIFSFKIDYSIPLQRYVRVIPDDRVVSIKINGAYIDLGTIKPEKLSDYEKGFVFDLAKYLKTGQNDIEIGVFNEGGRAGLNVVSALADPIYLILLLLIFMLILLVVFCVLRDFRVSGVYSIVIICSIFLSILYLTVTPYNIRSHDADAHVEYIEYIVKNKSIPSPEQGWVFYHPPLYYLMGAGVYSLINFIGINKSSIYYVLQVLSLVFYFIYLLVNLNTFQAISSLLPTGKKYFLLVGFSLLALWPSGIIHSVRVGNDSLFYLLFALAFNSIIKWEIGQSDRHLTLFSLWATLSLITKTNGLILFGISGVLILLRFLRSRDKKKWIKYLRKSYVVIVCFLIGFFIAFHNPMFNFIKGRRVNFLVGNLSTLAASLNVGNEAKNYLWFDTKIFLTEPFTSPWDDRMGRQYFWNYLFKTALFGEFSYSDSFHKNLAIVMSLVFLFMLLFVVVGLGIMNLREYRKILSLLISVSIIILSAIFFRISIPSSCSNDFRYIFPVLIPICFLYSYILSVFESRGFKKAVIVGIMLVSSFIVFSSLFISALFLVS